MIFLLPALVMICFIHPAYNEGDGLINTDVTGTWLEALDICHNHSAVLPDNEANLTTLYMHMKRMNVTAVWAAFEEKIKQSDIKDNTTSSDVKTDPGNNITRSEIHNVTNNVDPSDTRNVTFNIKDNERSSNITDGKIIDEPSYNLTFKLSLMADDGKSDNTRDEATLMSDEGAIFDSEKRDGPHNKRDLKIILQGDRHLNITGNTSKSNVDNTKLNETNQPPTQTKENNNQTISRTLPDDLLTGTLGNETTCTIAVITERRIERRPSSCSENHVIICVKKEPPERTVPRLKASRKPLQTTETTTGTPQDPHGFGIRVAAIACASAVGLFFLVIIIYCCAKNKKQKQKPPQPPSKKALKTFKPTTDATLKYKQELNGSMTFLSGDLGHEGEAESSAKEKDRLI